MTTPTPGAQVAMDACAQWLGDHGYIDRMGEDALAGVVARLRNEVRPIQPADGLAAYAAAGRRAAQKAVAVTAAVA